MTLDLEAIRAEAEKEMSPEWLEAYGDASRAAALHALGEPVPLELERKASVQIKKNAEHPRADSERVSPGRPRRSPRDSVLGGVKGLSRPTSAGPPLSAALRRRPLWAAHIFAPEVAIRNTAEGHNVPASTRFRLRRATHGVVGVGVAGLVRAFRTATSWRGRPHKVPGAPDDWAGQPLACSRGGSHLRHIEGMPHLDMGRAVGGISEP